MKKGVFNFVWLFAIIAGGSLLFLAVYGATKIGQSGQYQKTSFDAKSISILTNPLHAGFSDARFGVIRLGESARIKNICIDEGFGKNRILLSERGLNDEWSEFGAGVSVKNKYIFSEKVLEGKELFVLSVPFEYPFKISDLLIVINKDYCFVDAPQEVKNRIGGLGIKMISFKSQSSDCPEDSTTVCFSGSSSSCDIKVSCSSACDEGTVTKDGENKRFVFGLLYGAIFSDNEIYSCNVKRLFFRKKKLLELYSSKAKDLLGISCQISRDFKSKIDSPIAFSSWLGSNEVSKSKALDKENKKLGCRLW
ncbi:hypothetical protein D6829_00400 [Candidatus Pacearchaeota archaeon]|nr:MAG: hypothetical protein D6829_00400 [Candidatus Pacearchaeota archaeon]